MSVCLEAVWLEELQCQAESLAYDLRSHTGHLYLPAMTCTDMSGCIALFQRIDPGVQAIQTWSGARLDTRYVRNGEQWAAYVARNGAIGSVLAREDIPFLEERVDHLDANVKLATDRVLASLKAWGGNELLDELRRALNIEVVH